MSLSNKITKLADKFSAHLSRKAEVDALESYPGESSSNKEKLEAAKKASTADLNNIMSSYYMYESQIEQAKMQMNHQVHLLQFAKKVQKLIDEMISDGNYFDAYTLRETIGIIEKEASALGKHLKTRISLAELQSLRLLKAFITDEVSKSLPKIAPPDWSAMSRRNRQEKSEDTSGILTEDDFINDNEPDTRRLGPGGIPDTLRSPVAPEHDGPVAAE